MPATSVANLPIAFAHDALVYRGGAERVVAALVRRWPSVPLYTSCYLPEHTFDCLRSANIHTSFLQSFAGNPQRVMRRIFPLMVPAFRSFDFSQYAVVFSSAAYAAKCIRVPSDVCHICYCYSPLRIAWRPQDYIGPATGRLQQIAMLRAAPLLRMWDFHIAKKVNFFATTCKNVAERIKTAYKRDAEVIHAPIDVALYRHQKDPEDFYLIVSRLNSYKRADLAIDAAKRLGFKLLIVGEGPQRSVLEEKAAGLNVHFLGHISDQELLGLYAKCRALIFPQEEDFGLTPLEAQASGRPVIALGAGGALETIIDGQTGIFFETQTVESLIEAIIKVERTKFDSEHIRSQAARFDVSVFCDRLESFIACKVKEFRASAGDVR